MKTKGSQGTDDRDGFEAKEEDDETRDRDKLAMQTGMLGRAEPSRAGPREDEQPRDIW